MDLFCGTGTITQLLAKKVKSNVVGVDIVESAIANAKLSAQLNGVPNVNFIAEDAGKFLLNHPEYKGQIGTIMLDPPRAGISPKTLRKVIRLEAERIVYISCNPATQARDTEILIESGYNLKKLSLCDQFPHTSHVETIALFEK
jgi:tRNA/tmRNA/rRNA uracil-C5-methylase (TrmA/RlmC/RlmD family)